MIAPVQRGCAVLGALSGNARVLQGGVMSNAVPFTLDALQLTGISPTPGGTGTAVTFTGTGFGAAQGSGVVWLGSEAADTVVSWSDTQVVATVAPGALSGIARNEQNGGWSNALGFTVPVTGGNTIMPSLLNMVVGDTHAIQALNASGQTVTGLTWTSSEPTIVSLSTDDPPLLTALAAGYVTITAGTATCDVTVSAALPLGTVIWSNPGDGSSVTSIVPAVPSTTGVADVFAFQADGTVQAITSDGSTAWTADVSQAEDVLPDLQGGLAVSTGNSIYKLDGITGQAYPAYTPPGPGCSTYCELPSGGLAVHPDGTIFTTYTDENGYNVIGIDPTTGTQKFTVPATVNGALPFQGGSTTIIVAGDYSYPYLDSLNASPATCRLGVLRVSSSGDAQSIPVFSATCGGWIGGTGHSYVDGAAGVPAGEFGHQSGQGALRQRLRRQRQLAGHGGGSQHLERGEPVDLEWLCGWQRESADLHLRSVGQARDAVFDFGGRCRIGHAVFLQHHRAVAGDIPARMERSMDPGHDWSATDVFRQAIADVGGPAGQRAGQQQRPELRLLPVGRRADLNAGRHRQIRYVLPRRFDRWHGRRLRQREILQQQLRQVLEPGPAGRPRGASKESQELEQVCLRPRRPGRCDDAGAFALAHGSQRCRGLLRRAVSNQPDLTPLGNPMHLRSERLREFFNDLGVAVHLQLL